MASRAQFYNNHTFTVHIAGSIGDPTGIQAVSVPVRSNPNWLRDMKYQFARMIGLESQSADRCDFRTVDGRSIAAVAPEKLRFLGKLHFFMDNKRVLLDRMPPVPVEYSTSKTRSIGEWVDRVCDALPAKVTPLLVGRSAEEVDRAIRAGGPVVKLIKEELCRDHVVGEGGGWKEFVRVHHMNSPMSLSDEEAEQVLDHLATNVILARMRSYIQAAAGPIRNYIIGLEMQRVQSDARSKGGGVDERHYAPLISGSWSFGIAANQWARPLQVHHV